MKKRTAYDIYQEIMRVERSIRESQAGMDHYGWGSVWWESCADHVSELRQKKAQLERELREIDRG